MASSHDVAVASIKHFLKMREALVEFQGMSCLLYRVNEDTARADFFGDLSHTLTFKEPVAVKLVVDIPDVLRKIHQMEWSSDDWKANPVLVEAKMDLPISEGDVVAMDRKWFTSINSSHSLANVERVYFQVVLVNSFVHYEPISRIVSLVPFLNEMPGVTSV